MLSVRPRSRSTASGSAIPPRPIVWRAGLSSRLVRFTGLGATLGAALLGIGAVRIAAAVLARGDRVTIPSLIDGVESGIGYIASFALGGFAVGALWPLRVRRWGRITADYLAAGIVIGAFILLIPLASTPFESMTRIGKLVVWTGTTLIFGTGVMLQNDDMVE